MNLPKVTERAFSRLAKSKPLRKVKRCAWPLRVADMGFQYEIKLDTAKDDDLGLAGA